ncbi:MAG: hypothetical protein DRI75_12780 [Bacteroidetes bacterium]|nr:MAG: hypothetical protein DRI75_12780 [Bacteroidota bacterium]
MKKNLIIPITLLLILGFTAPIKSQSLPIVSDSVVLDKLFTLSESQNFFELKPTYNQNKEKLSEPDKLYFISIIENAFSNPRESNIAINKLKDLYPNAIADSLMQTLYLLKALNHTKLYEYDLATQNGEYLLKNYSNVLDSNSIADIENTNKIWSALKNVPKQKVTRNNDFTMPLVRDIAGLYNVDVILSGTTQHMIFDTGADFSAIRRSLVKKFGLTLIKSDFELGTGTEVKVKSDLAVADRIDIGGITFENVVFLVVDDELMSVPGYDFYGVIGMPVIEAMEEIHITSDDSLFVPKKLTHYNNNNFALKGLKPIVAVKHKGDNLIFHFDTGANHTSLYLSFLNKYKEAIESNYSKIAFSDGSLGGNVNSNGYKISVGLSIAGADVELDNIRVFTDDKNDDGNNVYGNLGQDYIKQFDKMIISFEHSSILFK